MKTKGSTFGETHRRRAARRRLAETRWSALVISSPTPLVKCANESPSNSSHTFSLTHMKPNNLTKALHANHPILIPSHTIYCSLSPTPFHPLLSIHTHQNPAHAIIHNDFAASLAMEGTGTNS